MNDVNFQMHINAKKGTTAWPGVVDEKGNELPSFMLSPEGIVNQYSGYKQIFSDLECVERLIHLLKENLDPELHYAVWMSAVVTYGKCFAQAKGRRIKLEKKHVSEFNEKALSFHEEIISMRNDYFAHAGNNEKEASAVWAVLDPCDKEDGVIAIAHMRVSKADISPEEMQSLLELCAGIKRVVHEITNGIEGRLLSDLSKIPKDDLYKKTEKIRTIKE